ncbi:MerR family transcriptional regulator [Clostridium tyrobutyricum]|uniref:Transcriptional regulator, MerR family n=1 Tax=Clostridium tyrobutyricum DIVETGP TaxID=1408889 RepID=W6N7K3_CLOTY|nr:MerR family transcriptional regulator [Clostridium tyrobutyricum]AND83832.1 transcriptional regulator [Clostridium tyrobutyricum]ANP68586.1 transcriptional regulator [Clostridium tyrobutyricum]MBV4433894.1 MerR family transcriptional regulator [Clostridium tyrobutyricum]MBV4446718.1 MerR family transcriptional regulator [Clostridium tyrobutyricum]QNB67072.1 MerR family transcriptional regulator [Clostridium tyrobutyricum]
MNIKIAAEKTGLTKKAIKYYECEGLINPSKNSSNNYREYTDTDIVKLNLIGALRVIDIPVSEIKCLIEGNKSLPDIMKNTLNKITENISNLEKSRLIISNILNKNLEDYSTIGEQVRKLRETLEFSISEKKEFISTRLLKIFPGNFGKIFVNSYEPFLNITVDSDEKKDAWVKLVEFLDDLNEIDNTQPFIKLMNSIDVNKIEEYRQKSKEDILENFNNNIFIEKIKKQYVEFIRFMNKDKEKKKIFAKSVSQTMDMFNGLGVDENIFDEYLEILNEDYKQYRQIGKKFMSEIDEELKKEFGFTAKEFFENLKTTEN